MNLIGSQALGEAEAGVRAGQAAAGDGQDSR